MAEKSAISEGEDRYPSIHPKRGEILFSKKENLYTTATRPFSQQHLADLFQRQLAFSQPIFLPRRIHLSLRIIAKQPLLERWVRVDDGIFPIRLFARHLLVSFSLGFSIRPVGDVSLIGAAPDDAGGARFADFLVDA